MGTSYEQRLETLKIQNSAKYFTSKYFSYCPYNGSQYEHNNIQNLFLSKLESNERNLNVIASRQRGTTSTLCEYAFWDAFMTQRSGRVNVIITPTLTQGRSLSEIIYNDMELGRDELLENTNIDIMKHVQMNKSGFQDDNRNSIIFGSVATLTSTLRGKHVSTLYMDNTWMHSGKTYTHEIDFINFIKACGTRIVMLQTALVGDKPSYVEEQSNVILLPDTLNANYSLEREETYINRIGATRFAQEYLLERTS